jgi:hypothetical protein
MPRLFRLAASVMFMAIILLLTARLIGGAQPTSVLVSVMSDPDGVVCDQPCLFGIRPGETSGDQAVLMLRAHPLTHDAKWRNEHTLRLAGIEAYVAFSLTEAGLVDSISLSDNLDDRGTPVLGSLADSIALGELIHTFGIPMVMLPESNYFVVAFPSAGITVASARPDDFKSRVWPHTSLSMVMTYNVRPCPNPKEGNTFFVHPWMGFTTIERYRDDLRLSGVLHRNSGVLVPPFGTCQE